MAKKNFPVVVNENKEFNLIREAEATVKKFKNEIFPLLFQVGLLDDKHVEKYLACDTTEAIYNDAITENPSSIYALEKEAYIEELKANHDEKKDVWALFREQKTGAKSPKEEGFVFKRIPHAERSIIKAISVQNLQFHIDREYFKEISIIHPTEEQVELYNTLLEFCEAYNKKNRQNNKLIRHLIYHDGKKIYPSLTELLGFSWIRVIKMG